MNYKKIGRSILMFLMPYLVVQLVIIEKRIYYHSEVICGEVTEFVKSGMKGDPSIIVNKGGEKYEFNEYLMDSQFDFIKQIEKGDRIIKLKLSFHFLVIKKNGEKIFFTGQGGENNLALYFFLMPQIPEREDFMKYNCN